MRYLTIAGHIGNYKSLKGKVDRSPPDRDTCHDLGASIFFNFVFFFITILIPVQVTWRVAVTFDLKEE